MYVSLHCHMLVCFLQKPRAANFINKIEVGMLCCAIYSNDNKWYRVVVKEVLPSRKVHTAHCTCTIHKHPMFHLENFSGGGGGIYYIKTKKNVYPLT